MATITELTNKYTEIDNAKKALAAAITDKGVAVPEGTKLAGMAPLVSSIAGGVELIYDNVVKLSSCSKTPVQKAPTYSYNDYGASASNENYALFAAVRTASSSSSVVKTVNALNESMSWVTVPNLSSTTTGNVRGSHVGKYALFAMSGYTDAYDETLTKTTTSALSAIPLRSTYNDSYAFFISATKVFRYDANLTLTTASTTHDTLGSDCTAQPACVGSYLLIPRGDIIQVYYNEDEGYVTENDYYTDNWTEASDTVLVYDENLTKQPNKYLSTGRAYAAMAGVGNYALVTGGFIKETWSGSGQATTTYTNTVEVYTDTLTRKTASALSQVAHHHGGATLCCAGVEHAIISGGRYNRSSHRKKTDMYNENLTKTALSDRTGDTYTEVAPLSFLNYALFRGYSKYDIEGYTMTNKLTIGLAGCSSNYEFDNGLSGTISLGTKTLTSNKKAFTGKVIVPSQKITIT